MKTNKFDINDLVSIYISDAEQATGRITEIQLFEGEILYHADLDKSMSGWYAENDFVLLANCELDADYYSPSPIEDLIELSKEMDALVGSGFFTVPDSGRDVYLPNGIKVDALDSGCTHQWVDVGFMQSKIVCKHCNKEQDS